MDDVMSTGSFKRDPVTIKKLYKHKGDGVVATDDFYIVFPERYLSKELAVMGQSVKLLSIYAIVDSNDNYAVVSAPIFMDVVPSLVTRTIIDGVVNVVLHIDKGSLFIPNRTALRNASFMYNLMEEFLMQGKVPWFMSYDDLSDIMLNSVKYAGNNVGNDIVAMEIMASIVARDSRDKHIPYRLVKNKHKVKPAYIGLSNVYYAFDNTLSKLMGGYMKQGVTTAIVNPEETTSKVSSILRA